MFRPATRKEHDDAVQPPHLDFAAVSLPLCGGLIPAAAKPACSTPSIETTSGPVCGATMEATFEGKGRVEAASYLGIPYAVSPVGPRRWQYSGLFAGHAPLVATAYGSSCPQNVVAAGAAGAGDRCADGRRLAAGESEDCLFLNVWTPSGADAGGSLPVMVFLHGGAFVAGSGNAESGPDGRRGNLYDGTFLAATGPAVVVTFNYRLGALGFLERDGAANFGLADQLLALEWVRRNIAAFGGDPGNVTLFGESAGAKSAGIHVFASSKSQGLFHAAILESDAFGLPYKGRQEAAEVRRAFCAEGAGPMRLRLQRLRLGRRPGPSSDQATAELRDDHQSAVGADGRWRLPHRTADRAGGHPPGTAPDGHEPRRRAGVRLPGRGLGAAGAGRPQSSRGCGVRRDPRSAFRQDRFAANPFLLPLPLRSAGHRLFPSARQRGDRLRLPLRQPPPGGRNLQASGRAAPLPVPVRSRFAIQSLERRQASGLAVSGPGLPHLVELPYVFNSAWQFPDSRVFDSAEEILVAGSAVIGPGLPGTGTRATPGRRSGPKSATTSSTSNRKKPGTRWTPNPTARPSGTASATPRRRPPPGRPPPGRPRGRESRQPAAGTTFCMAAK